MPTTPARAVRQTRAVGVEDVLSDDGTRIRTWTNDPDRSIDGPTVVLCNGLGTNPWAWPALLDRDCGVRVVSWQHRGTGGSDRPADPRRVGVEEFVEDALSVMDHYGVDRAVIMGWSIGVNTAFELATHHPERVRGIFAVAGVPGDTFATMLAPLRVPRWAARQLTVNLARGVRLSGCALTPLTQRIPVGSRGIAALGRTGFMGRVPDPELAARAVREFLTTPAQWYAHLALRTSEHARVSLSSLTIPAFFVAGTHDVLTGARDMRSAAERMNESTYVELRSSHFVQMEQPEVVHDLLLEFLEQVG